MWLCGKRGLKKSGFLLRRQEGNIVGGEMDCFARIGDGLQWLDEIGVLIPLARFIRHLHVEDDTRNPFLVDECLDVHFVLKGSMGNGRQFLLLLRSVGLVWLRCPPFRSKLGREALLHARLRMQPLEIRYDHRIDNGAPMTVLLLCGSFHSCLPISSQWNNHLVLQMILPGHSTALLIPCIDVCRV